MLIDHLEPQFQHLGIPLDRPRIVLAIPLLGTLTADREMSRDEAAAVAQFCREILCFDQPEMHIVHGWTVTPPSAGKESEVVDLIERLLAADDVPTIETRTVVRVLSECERLLRERELQFQQESPKGRAFLDNASSRLGIDLGEPWEDIAPEVFSERNPEHPEPSHHSGTATRRLRTARRLDEPSPPESGGLV